MAASCHGEVGALGSLTRPVRARHATPFILSHRNSITRRNANPVMLPQLSEPKWKSTQLGNSGHDLTRPYPLEQSMASISTAQPIAALVIMGSIQIAVMILEAACGKPGTGQWLIILIFRRDGRTFDVWTGKVRMAEMKLDLVRFEPARRVGVQP